jgi:endoribonuclease Dicer
MGVDFWARDQWLRELELGITDVIVCTPQIFYNCLAHAYLCMEECSLLIIDECHHARKKHPLNTTLMHFYHSIGRGQPRPKILGLTASPIWNPVNPLKSLEVLESNLQASIIAVKGNMDELERYSYRPTEVVEMYQDNNYLEPGELYRDLSAIGFAGTDEARWDKIFVKSQVALEVLGPIGMNQFLIQLYRQPLEMMVRSASYTTNLSPDELQGIQRAKDLVDNSYENLPASIPVNDLPNKVSKLVQILTQYRQSSLDSGTDDTGFQCIIFVVQRHIAYGLAWMLERIEPLRKWLKIQTLVGHGTRKSLEGQSQDLKQQQETVKDFREGKYNVLISTA